MGIMRNFKFRGRVPDSDKIDGGKIVFGNLVVYADASMYTHWIYPFAGDRNFPVEPDSVALRVGYDKQGREVYQGDVIEFTDTGEPLSAELTPCLADKYRRTYFSGNLIRLDDPNA